MTEFLAPLPEEITLTDDDMGLEDLSFEVGGYDEFQMLAEHELIKKQFAAKQYREARRSW